MVSSPVQTEYKPAPHPDSLWLSLLSHTQVRAQPAPAYSGNINILSVLRRRPVFDRLRVFFHRLRHTYVRTGKNSFISKYLFFN